MNLIYNPYDSKFVRSVRDGGLDANGQVAERCISDGLGNPCRSCLHNIPEGVEMLILAARPFQALQPYAEVGPIFLCADNCVAWNGKDIPPILKTSPDYLLKGYCQDERIIYGTGKIVKPEELDNYAKGLLAENNVAYVDVRSSRNNCFQVRITNS